LEKAHIIRKDLLSGLCELFELTYALGGSKPTIVIDNVNVAHKDKFNKTGLVLDISNYQVELNTRLIESPSKVLEVKDFVINVMLKQPGVAMSFEIKDVQTIPLEATIRKMINNGYYPSRFGQIQLILQPQYIEGFLSGGTILGLWIPHDSHIPLVFYGWELSR